MSKKKVTGEDGKTYVVKEKKPFYKRVWFWVLIILVVLVGAGMAGGSDDDSASTDTAAKTEKKAAATKKPASKITKANFDTINVSDSDGESPADVKKLFGKSPDSTSEDTIEDVKSEMHIWNNVDGGSLGSNIVIGFSNGHAISKNISGIKVDRKNKIKKADVDSIQNGMSKDEITKKFGDPNGYDITNIVGQTDEMWSYDSDINGDAGANFNVTFTNGTVSGKSQTSMK